MIVAESPDVYGYTIFCDDIRVEVGGKLTYVGAYQGVMTVHMPFPATLPRFAMHFVYMQRRPNVIPPSKIIIVTPGTTEENPAITIDIPETESVEALANAETLAKNLPGERTFATMQGPIMLTNFLLNEPGVLKVRAARGDQFIRLGALRILQGPTAESKT